MPVDPPLPIVSSTTLLEKDDLLADEIQMPKKKTSSRKTLENYFNEKSDTESIPREPDAEYSTPPPKSPEVILPEPEVVSPEPEVTLSEPEVASPEPEVEKLAESIPPTPIPLDQTLDSVPDPVSEKEDEIDEIIEEKEDEIEEEIQSGSISFNVASESGLSDTANLNETGDKEYSPVTICVKRLEAVENAPNRENLIFIEYEFCGSTKETEASLPFPSADNPTLFDYSETFKFTVSIKLKTGFSNSFRNRATTTNTCTLRYYLIKMQSLKSSLHWWMIRGIILTRTVMKLATLKLTSSNVSRCF